MFRVIISTSPTWYAFLSGLLISVATSAATVVAFAEPGEVISPSVSWAGVLAFVAGALWFWESELVASLNRRVDALAPALGSRAAAIAGLGLSKKIQCISLAAAALICSFLWPFPRFVEARQEGPSLQQPSINKPMSPPVEPNSGTEPLPEIDLSTEH